jgi:hypothetical protein
MKTRKTELTRINVLRAGGVGAGVYCVILLLVFPLALGLAALASDGNIVQFIGYYIASTIGYVIVGFVVTALSAFAYNIVARHLGGGLVLEITETAEQHPTPAYVTVS